MRSNRGRITEYPGKLRVHCTSILPPPSLPSPLSLSLSLSLGFPGAILATGRSLLGRANYTTPIFLNNVLCFGDELALSQCHHSPVGETNYCSYYYYYYYSYSYYSHYRDAGVVCQGTYMWQSQVEIQHYSIAYFNLITTCTVVQNFR